MTPTQLAGAVLVGCVVVVALAVRLSRMRRMRPLNPRRLWIAPLIYLAIAATVFAIWPPQDANGWMICLAAFAVGAAIGWQRGKLMRIQHDPVTGAFQQQASPWAMILILVLIAGRFAFREVIALEGANQAVVHLTTDALLAFMLAMLSVQRLEMFLRARKLTAVAGAAAAAAN